MKTFLLFLLLWLAAGALLPARAQSLTAEWAVQCATNGQPYSLVTDAQGNAYVAGTFSGTITLGATTLTATQAAPGYNAPQDVFLTKLDAQGQYVWAVQFGDGQAGFADVGAVDNAGNLFVSGSFTSYSYRLGAGGPLLYNSSNDAEGFVARFSAQTGQCQWARRFGGTGADYAGGFVLNAAGDLLLTGTVGYGAADFGPHTLPTALNYGGRPFLARLSATGNWGWVQELTSLPPGSYDTVYVGLPLLDGAGSLYLTGTFNSPTLTLGATTLTTTRSVNGVGADLFIAKYTEGGVLRWARQASPGGDNNLSGGAVFYDGQGRLYFNGSFTSQTARLGPFLLNNAGPLVPPPIGPAPPVPNTSRYYTDGFLACYDTAGTWRWASRRGGYNTNDVVYMTTLDGAGRLFALYDTGYTSPVSLVAVDSNTGNWGTGFTLPSNVGLIRDQLGRFYVYGPFMGSSVSLGGKTVPGAGGTATTGYVARLGQVPLVTYPAATARPELQAWPTPGPGTGVWVQGAKPGQEVDVFDVLGRRVGGGRMPASGPLRLNWPGAGLAPGVYVLRGGAHSCRWVVEA